MIFSRDSINVQLASLSAFPIWYPILSLNLISKGEILNSRMPGCLSHIPSDIFNKKTCFKDIIGGKSHLYKGFGYAAAFQPLFPLTFALRSNLVDKKNSELTNIAITYGIGASTVLLANPIDVAIMRKQQNLPVFEFVKKNGFSSMYTGALPFALRNGIFFCGLTHAHESLQAMNNKHSIIKNDYLANTIISTAIATVMSTATVPLELAFVMKQSPNYSKLSTVQCLTSVYQKHGISGIFVGYRYSVLRGAVELFAFNLFLKFYRSLTN